MKKIKLFVDGHWFDEPYQSTGVFLKGLYNELIDDDRFEIYFAAANIEQLKTAFNNSDKIKYLPFKSHSKYYRLAIDAPHLIERYKIDISHFQYTTPLVKKSREIVTIHDLLFKEFKDLFPWSYRITKDFLFKRSAKRSDLITTVSKYSADSIIKHYKISPQKIKVIPNGISSDFFVDYDENDLPDVTKKYNLNKYILGINRIEPRKNHISLLKSYVELALWKKDIKLVLIGRQDIKVPELESYLNHLPAHVQKNILWLRNVNFTELLSFYKNASLFVYPSIAEGFGIPPLEAAALKTKTLCSNATAMADFSFFGNDLFDPTNIKELSHKILTKLEENNITRRNEIAHIIRDNYKWENIASDFASTVYALFK